MAKRAGSADLPLHGGRVPQWLADRMTRLGAVMSAMQLFAAMMTMSLLGALLTLTPRLWYPSYSAPPFGFTPLEDQQLAGLVMWIPGCSVYAIAALVFLAAWIAWSGNRAPL